MKKYTLHYMPTDKYIDFETEQDLHHLYGLIKLGYSSIEVTINDKTHYIGAQVFLNSMVYPAVKGMSAQQIAGML